jgi:hypothetical protein
MARVSRHGFAARILPCSAIDGRKEALTHFVSVGMKDRRTDQDIDIKGQDEDSKRKHD